LPLRTFDRQDWATVLMDHAAHFKALRAPFGPVKLRYHTGVDIRNKSYTISGEPVYAIAAGAVIAVADPHPQRRIVIEHTLPNQTKVWSVYVHIIDETVKVGDRVDTETIIARLLNDVELELYGQHYHHVHLEIMKIMPTAFANFYQRETFTCYTEQEVDKYFFNPEEFLKKLFIK